jgi:hypothetical protein
MGIISSGGAGVRCCRHIYPERRGRGRSLRRDAENGTNCKWRRTKRVRYLLGTNCVALWLLDACTC